MSNDDTLGTQPSRRPPRQGMGASPAGSTLSIVLAVIAVVAGFLILRNITDDGGASSNAGDLGDVTSPDVTETTLADTTSTTVAGPATTTTTTIPRVTEGATVVVANVNTVGGSAGAMTKTLELAGYTMGDPVNGTGPNVDESIVYYDETVAAAQDVANSVANDMGGVSVLPVPTPPPTESGTLDGAGVLVMLGNNEAGKTLEELAESSAVATTDATGTAPPVAGSDEVTTTVAEATE